MNSSEEDLPDVGKIVRNNFDTLSGEKKKKSVENYFESSNKGGKKLWTEKFRCFSVVWVKISGDIFWPAKILKIHSNSYVSILVQLFGFESRKMKYFFLIKYFHDFFIFIF
eukprot:Sdes_comp17533_c0_seq1m6777